MPNEIRKWIPIGSVILACFLLWYVSQPEVQMEARKPVEKMAPPSPVATYVAPAGLRNPMDASVVIDVVKAYEKKLVHKSTATAHVLIPSRRAIRIEGIVWSPSLPLVSINGKLVREGGHIPQGRVLRIRPTKVRLEIDGKIVEKKVMAP